VQRVAPQIDPIYSQKLVLLLKCRGDNWEQEEGLLKAKRGDDRGLFKARSEQGVTGREEDEKSVYRATECFVGAGCSATWEPGVVLVLPRKRKQLV
jgi:hypothetical protein